MNRLNFSLFLATLLLFSTISALASEIKSDSGQVKAFSFAQQSKEAPSALNFSTENPSKEKIKFNGKMKAGLVIGIIGSVTLNNAFSAGVATSILWSLSYYVNSWPTTDENALGKGITFFSLLISAIATAVYATFNFFLGLALTIIGFSLLSRGRNEMQKITLETSHENRPALAFALKL